MINQIIAAIGLALSAIISYLIWTNNNLEMENMKLFNELSGTKLKLENANKLYNAKKKEMDLNTKTMERIENELKTIKNKVDKLRPGSTTELEL